MVMGLAIANLARHHDRPRREIETFEQPFLVLFFILAGAALEVGALAELGLVGAAYILLRTAGLWLGGWLGARLAGLSGPRARLVGLAITPQAGVALGMALVAKSRFPEVGDMLLGIVISTTVVFELIGPVVTRWTLSRVGEIGEGRA
jgi:Kef-type K+ transport system membrane component KefB